MALQKYKTGINMADAKALSVPQQPHVKLIGADCPKTDNAASHIRGALKHQLADHSCMP